MKIRTPKIKSNKIVQCNCGKPMEIIGVEISNTVDQYYSGGSPMKVQIPQQNIFVQLVCNYCGARGEGIAQEAEFILPNELFLKDIIISSLSWDVGKTSIPSKIEVKELINPSRRDNGKW